jgi:hypothetical protein
MYGITSVAFGADGRTWCDNAVDATKCDQHYVNFRSNSVVTAGLACHETGHAVGLLHGQDASPAQSNTEYWLFCMQDPVGPGVGLGAHNAAQINAVYSRRRPR